MVEWLTAALVALQAIPGPLLRAVEHIESRSNAFAYSSAGCIGVMQICPRYSPVPTPLLWVPAVNRAEGARMMDWWRRKSKGNIRLALAGYRCGYAGLHNKCGQRYASAVLKEVSRGK